MGCEKLQIQDFFSFVEAEDKIQYDFRFVGDDKGETVSTVHQNSFKSIEEGFNKKAYIPSTDKQGTVHSYIDASNGETVQNISYDPYGRVLSNTGSVDLPLKFQTKYYDSELGLYYYGFRYYDPSTCKWLSRDPRGEAGGLNLYAFVNGDPVNGVDYLGLNPLEWIFETAKNAGMNYLFDKAKNKIIETADKVPFINKNSVYRWGKLISKDTSPYGDSLDPVTMFVNMGSTLIGNIFIAKRAGYRPVASGYYGTVMTINPLTGFDEWWNKRSLAPFSFNENLDSLQAWGKFGGSAGQTIFLGLGIRGFTGWVAPKITPSSGPLRSLFMTDVAPLTALERILNIPISLRPYANVQKTPYGFKDPAMDAEMYAGAYDPHTNILHIGDDFGHFGGMNQTGGTPIPYETPGITVTVRGHFVYWDKFSPSLPGKLTAVQTAQITKGLKLAFPGKQVIYVNDAVSAVTARVKGAQ